VLVSVVGVIVATVLNLQRTHEVMTPSLGYRAATGLSAHENETARASLLKLISVHAAKLERPGSPAYPLLIRCNRP
jgi:hypothetical protein